MNKYKLKSNPLIVILFTVFIDVLGVGILIPVIPLLLADPTSPYNVLPKGYSLNQGFVLLGYLLAIYPFMQFLATPILGQLSDKFGRKRVLAISLTGTCISYILFAVGILTKNLPFLFISRGFDGITGGNISVAQAAMADISTNENRSRTFGLLGAVFGIGFVIGPTLGGKLSDPNLVSWFNAATPFWFAAILSFINIISVLTIFPETLKNIQSHIVIEWNKSIHNVINAFKIKDLRTLFFTSFLFNAGFTFFTTFFGVFLLKRFGFHQGRIGDFFSYVGIWIAFSQIFVVRNLTRKFTDYKILRIALILTGLSILLYFLPKHSWQLLLVVPFFAIANGSSQATLTGLISNSTDQENQGRVLGINSSLQALGQTIPAVLSGYIAATIGSNSPIIVSSIVIVSAGLLFLLFYKDHGVKPSEEAVNILHS